MNITGINRIILITGISVGVMITVFLIVRGYSWAAHPEQTVTWKKGDTIAKVVFYEPEKIDDQRIFGGYIPYGQMWQASEKKPALFESSVDLIMDGSRLSAGSYALWIKPMASSWKIMFNKSFSSTYNANDNVLVLQRPVKRNYAPLEELTYYFTSAGDQELLFIAWGETTINIPFTFAP